MPARAQVIDLIENGGFETGDLTGWIAEPAPSGSAFGVDHGAGFGLAANSGSHWIGFGATEGVYDTISQSLPTTPGAAYNISLWVLNPNTDSDLLVSWGGDTLLHITSSDTLGSYQALTHAAVATPRFRMGWRLKKSLCATFFLRLGTADAALPTKPAVEISFLGLTPFRDLVYYGTTDVSLYHDDCTC